MGFSDFLVLKDIGLLFETDLNFQLFQAEEETKVGFTCGSTAVVVSRPKGTPAQAIPAIGFTQIGFELLHLVDKLSADLYYIKMFSSLLRYEGVVIQYGVGEWVNGGIKYKNLEILPG